MTARKKADATAVDEGVAEDAPAEAAPGDDDGVPTTSKTQKVKDAAGKEWVVPAESPEVARGPLDNVPDDGEGQTEYAGIGVPHVPSRGVVEEGAENPPSPEVERGPLESTPS